MTAGPVLALLLFLFFIPFQSAAAQEGPGCGPNNVKLSVKRWAGSTRSRLRIQADRFWFFCRTTSNSIPGRDQRRGSASTERGSARPKGIRISQSGLIRANTMSVRTGRIESRSAFPYARHPRPSSRPNPDRSIFSGLAMSAKRPTTTIRWRTRRLRKFTWSPWTTTRLGC